MYDFLSYGFLAIFRDVLLTPKWAVPLDTAAQIVEQGREMLGIDGGHFWIEHLLDSPVEDYQIIGATAIMPKDYDQYLKLFEQLVMKDETHVALGVLDEEDNYGPIHMSSEAIGGTMPYGGWIINRNYALQDELDRHRGYPTII